jgi:hypothetical protein
MARTAKRGEIGLERRDFRTLNELAMRQHARHGIVD